MPREAMELLAMQYWHGSGKYADHNFRKGFPWRFHFNAVERHMSAFWRGEDLDLGTEENPGSGLPHPIAAAWHCLALTQAMLEHPEMDDRPEPVSTEAHERFSEFKAAGEHYYDLMMEAKDAQ